MPRMHDDAFVADVRVDAARSLGPLPRPWRYFGADEPNYCTTPQGRALLAEIGALAPGETYFRAHNLLTSGDGTPSLKWGSTDAYREDAEGRPIHDFSRVDAIFDAGLEHGVRPLVEIGFMPEPLSSGPPPYRHAWPESLFTGWTYPPRDYARWQELVYEWGRHALERHGERELERWLWQVWNEPNIGYWSGSLEEFLRLHDHAVAGLRRALPRARVGGPHVAGDGGEFMQGYLDHVLRGRNHATGEIGTRLDYLSFHAKGQPELLEGQVCMGLAAQLRTIDRAFARFARYPELSGKPVIIGESDPEGCAACTGPELAYRNGTLYSSYTAAAFPRKLELAARHGIALEGAVTWAYTFVDQPFFAGFRQLSSNGVPLAVFNAFRMLSRLAGEQVQAASSAELPLDELLERGVRGRPDVGVLASRSEGEVAALVWHYHDHDVPGPDARVRLELSGLPASASGAMLSHYRVDATHGNAYGTWIRQGRPARPSPAQRAELERASELPVLEGAPARVAIAGGVARLEFLLGRQGVSLIVLGGPG